MVHITMNGLVVLLQTVFKDYLEQADQLQEQLNIIIHMMM